MKIMYQKMQIESITCIRPENHWAVCATICSSTIPGRADLPEHHEQLSAASCTVHTPVNPGIPDSTKSSHTGSSHTFAKMSFAVETDMFTLYIFWCLPVCIDIIACSWRMSHMESSVPWAPLNLYMLGQPEWNWEMTRKQGNRDWTM